MALPRASFQIQLAGTLHTRKVCEREKKLYQDIHGSPETNNQQDKVKRAQATFAGAAYFLHLFFLTGAVGVAEVGFCTHTRAN